MAFPPLENEASAGLASIDELLVLQPAEIQRGDAPELWDDEANNVSCPAGCLAPELRRVRLFRSEIRWLTAIWSIDGLTVMIEDRSLGDNLLEGAVKWLIG